MSAAVERMNLLELIDAYRARFYSPQTWYIGEAFMRILPDPYAPDTPPRRVTHTGQIPRPTAALPHAVDLAHAYIKNPSDPVWLRYLWTADFDSQGQRVYVGVNGKGLEIHRHIHISERFGQPAW